MTHRSRLAGFIIDCNTDDLDTAARFWSDALGLPIGELSPEESATYAKLDDAPGDLHIEVQKVTHPSRVHLDIETDDIEAEVARLEALGAKARAIRPHLVRDGSPHRPAFLRGADETPGARGHAERVVSGRPPWLRSSQPCARRRSQPRRTKNATVIAARNTP